MSRTSLLAISAVTGAAALAATTVVQAGSYERDYRVTIVNITPGNQLTPILAAVHDQSASLFSLGEPSSDELATLAETGDTGPLQGTLESLPGVSLATTIPGPAEGGLMFPGESVEFEITATGKQVMSFASMMLPTNDSFAALNSVRLPRYGSRQYMAVGYDAGSEANDEMCMNIPGPTCGEDGGSPEGEGFVHVSSGIHGIGDLAADEYDWRNPVVSVTVERIR